jgi:translation initiation factor IF-2
VQAELVPEDWGGETPFVEISAKQGIGMEALLETVAIVAEVEEFVANPEREAEGTVLESHMDRRSGPVCSLLVQAGTLKVSSFLFFCRFCLWLLHWRQGMPPAWSRARVLA